MSKKLIYDKPMTKAQKDKRYKSQMKGWKDRNYLTFCFHLPKNDIIEFRKNTKKNRDIQRQLIIEFIQNYNKNTTKKKEDDKNV